MAHTHPIELEIRGEIRHGDIPAFTKRLLAQRFRHISTTRRTSVMSFGMTEGAGKGWRQKETKQEVDIRCRITNGSAEVVAKIGISDAHNRIEIAKAVSKNDLFVFARMFGTMGFFTKVGSKVTHNYKRGSITASIVQSPSGITYVELEKMSTPAEENKDLDTLTTLAQDIELTLFPSRQAFLDLCSRLTREDDWEFTGTDEDVARLKKEIQKAGSGRTGR